MWSQGLELMVPVDPFQLGIFYDFYNYLLERGVPQACVLPSHQTPQALSIQSLFLLHSTLYFVFPPVIVLAYISRIHGFAK